MASDTDVVRIPLTITATGSGQKTDGVLVAVAVSQLDALEARLAAAEAVIDQIKHPQAGVDNDGYWDALKAYRALQGQRAEGTGGDRDGS